MALSHANDDYPVTIGSQVGLVSKGREWRIEVTDPQTMKAVWITHDVLGRIIEAEALGAELVSGLAQIYRAEIERHIKRAEMENWKDFVGGLPQGMDGFYQR